MNKKINPCIIVGRKPFYFFIISIFLSFSTTALSAAGSDVYTQKKSFTVKMENKTVKDVINYIENNSEFIFMYTKDLLNSLDNKVSINVDNKNISTIMNLLASETGIKYEIKDRQIILSEATEKQQQKKGININGTVWDEQGNPLPGVNVVVKSSNTGATTDINGNYFLTVPGKSSVLTFSYIGFESKEVTVGGQININVNLKEISTGLNEVVVVGFGSQKRESIVGSITTIEPGLLQQSPTRALSNNLAGQLAGVIAVQRSGEPGADGSSFWIRGISSFQSSGRSPLVLVDGIERTLDDMDPAEIESFSVLKDAAASAVYGVRGANGVILINTKRGQLGKPNIDVHYEHGFTQPVKLPKFVNSADYLSLLDELQLDAGYTQPTYGSELIQQYRDNIDPDLYPNVNWLDAVTKDHATNQRANITVSGGSDILRYALVASYYGERGIFERDPSQTWDSSTKLNKYNMRSNVDVNVTKTTIARISIGGYLQETNGMAVSSDDVFNAAFETTPFAHPAVYSSGEFPRVKGRVNPWVMATQHGFSTYSNAKIESLFSLEQDLKFLLPGLKIKGIFSFDRYMRSGIVRSKSPDYYNPATTRKEDGTLDLTIGSYGQMFLGTEKKTEWGNKATYLEGNLSYSQKFGEHSVEGMFLYNQRDYQDGSVVPYRRMGIAGRASYTYGGRYIAEFNFGYNGSENFAKGKRFGFFPSVAVGYLLSEERFMEPFKETLSKLKLRASWGLVGNDQLSGRRFAYITTIEGGGTEYRWGVNNDYHRSGRYEGDFGIPNLTWETVEKMNVGLEMGLLNAFDLQVDWFKEKRRDIFMQRNTIPSSAGFKKTPWANYGKVDNEGVDMSLTYNKQLNKDWYVGFRGTFTYAKNKILELDEAPGVMGTNRQRTGLPVGQLFGLVADRLFTEDDFVDVENGILKDGIPSQTFTTKVRPGDIKYIDVDDDGAITTMDEKAIGGTYDPQIVYGFGANATFKNIDVNVFFQGNGKTYRFIGGNNFLPGSTMGTMGNILDNYQDRWTLDSPSQDVFYPRLSYGENENNNKNSTWWLRNMSMLRMRDVEVGYRFPKPWMNKIGIRSLRLYLKGSNLLTFSGFKLWDPEVDTGNGMKYPIMKSLSFGLDINF